MIVWAIAISPGLSVSQSRREQCLFCLNEKVLVGSFHKCYRSLETHYLSPPRTLSMRFGHLRLLSLLTFRALSLSLILEAKLLSCLSEEQLNSLTFSE